ncbi:3-mercaptopyruvate sulfurtransferase [Neotabrizicola sp. sgz301269]|uniref:3-mercaptopyruvate sulfurtransferase n=1 Tax=Neotabrizicola sp. sgz301269 TaxID=3276282 RepID=UPI00376F7508
MMRRDQPLVSTRWVAEHLGAPGLVVLDASFVLPGGRPTAAELYAQRHLPDAVFFDIDAVADHGTPLPHMLPTPEAFARMVGAMGIGNDTAVVVYDTPGLMSAGRAWWTLRAFGHDRVAVMDGGLKKWQAEGRPLTDRVPSPSPARFTPAFRPDLIRARDQVRAALETGSAQVVDARSAARFTGAEPEARPGLRSGHMPGARNLPFGLLSNPETGEVLAPAAIRAAFSSAGIDPSRPIIASCGSGVTAAALAFGLHLIGAEASVYDGAWAEWGQAGDTPVVTGGVPTS